MDGEKLELWVWITTGFVSSWYPVCVDWLGFVAEVVKAVQSARITGLCCNFNHSALSTAERRHKLLISGIR
jgi:hypothetical protein